jgi:NAD(P)-dependent dehydrogenase (short-subunit alcohol dehydrogenase family)
MSVDGRICVVTGAASGIGRATSLLLAERGASVVGVDLREPEGAWPTAELDRGAAKPLFVTGDLTSAEDRDRAVAVTLEAHGRIDALINCAGIASRTPIPDLEADEWDRVFSINLKAVFFLCQRVLETMVAQRSGTIVTIASAAAKLGGVAVGAHYAASKAGIICLTKSLAGYGAPHGVTANSVCPGPTETGMIGDWEDELNASFRAKIPLGRYGTADEVARTICFLASSEASYITGETIDVNGGLIMD